MGENVSHPSNNPEHRLICRKILNPDYYHKKIPKHSSEPLVQVDSIDIIFLSGCS